MATKNGESVVVAGWGNSTTSSAFFTPTRSITPAFTVTISTSTPSSIGGWYTSLRRMPSRTALAVAICTKTTTACWPPPLFRTQVRRRWCELSPRFRALVADIDRWHAQIRPSALADERLWRGKDPARFDTFDSFDASSANLKSLFLRRIDALDRLLAE